MPSEKEPSSPSEPHSSPKPESRELTREEALDCIKRVARMQKLGLLESPDRHPTTPDEEILSRLD